MSYDGVVFELDISLRDRKAFRDGVPLFRPVSADVYDLIDGSNYGNPSACDSRTNCKFAKIDGLATHYEGSSPPYFRYRVNGCNVSHTLSAAAGRCFCNDFNAFETYRRAVFGSA